MEPLKQEDIKPGETYEVRMFGRSMDVKVVSVNPSGMVTTFGPVPWSSLPMMQRKERADG